MTSVSSIITAAFRKGQVIAKVSAPDTTEQAEALAMTDLATKWGITLT